MRTVTSTAVLLVLLAASGQAVQMAVPDDLQAALFKKILGFNQSFAGDTIPTIAILHDAGQEAAASELRLALAKVGLESTPVGPQSPEEALGEGGVVYLLSPDPPAALKLRCERTATLTITGWPSLVEAGRASVGLGRKTDGRPEIIVHMESLKAEGQRFSLDLLGLARVVR